MYRGILGAFNAALSFSAWVGIGNLIIFNWFKISNVKEML